MSEYTVVTNLPKDGGVYGGWVSQGGYKNGDVHINVCEREGAVISYAKSYTDDAHCDELCVSLKDGAITFWHYDKEGKIHNHPVPPEYFRLLVLEFLGKFEALHGKTGE